MPNSDYITAVGRRKTSTASVRMIAGKESVTVNGKEPLDYFKTATRVQTVMDALKKAEAGQSYTIQAVVSGGGISSQAGAVRHAISRALVEAEPNTRKPLKALGYLTRDPRVKERKKPGLVKARKRKQWSKR